MSGQAKGALRLADLDYSVLQQCMHCGMCLPTCPTFAETGRERHSPRGRIALLRAVADKEIPLERQIADEMQFCLGCLACTTACPAGVNYLQLFETARFEVEKRGLLDNPRRQLIRRVTVRGLFMHPRLLRLAGRALWLYQALGLQFLVRRSRVLRLFPKRLGELEAMRPEIRSRFSHQLIRPVEKPSGQPVAASRQARRVLVLTGCMQDLMYSEINRATVDVLLENGCEVHTPPVQFCCGSLHAHNGDQEAARELARRQLDAIDPASYDAIISNAGGCGSHLSHYGHLLADDPAYASRAEEWSRKLKDIHAWLVEIGFRAPSRSPFTPGTRLTYHESCHLTHGQKVVQPPRSILRSLPGIHYVELAEANWCCGSAGVYNITQPRTAKFLLERKLGHVEDSSALIVALANPGCHLQVENGLKARHPEGQRPRVAHPIVLLAECYRAEKQTS